MANRLATITDIITYNQVTTELRVGDYIIDTKNAGVGTSILISSGQGNLISSTAFNPATNNIWILGGTYGYIHINDDLDGGSPGRMKIKPLGQVIIDAELQPAQSRALLLQQIKNFHVEGEINGFIGHLYGMPEFLQGRYGFYIKNRNTTVSRVSVKIDDANTGWWISGLEIDGGGFEYSGISTHEAGVNTVRFQDIVIRNCYIHDTMGEAQYHGSNSDTISQHGYYNVLIQNCVMVRGGLELFQLQHGEGKIIIENCIQVCSALNRKNPFQKFQDRNLQFQNIRSGEYVVRNSIFIGGGEAIFVCQFSTADAVTIANRDIVYKNNFFGYVGNYGAFFGNGNGTTGIRLEGNYFKNIGNPFNYSEVYPDEVQKNYTLLFQNSNTVTLGDNFYETTNFRSGNADSFVESGNTLGTVTDIQFLRCPIREKAGSSYAYHLLQTWNFEIMVDTVGTLTDTNAGDAINYVVGDFVMHEGYLYECILNHTPSDGDNTGTFDNAKKPDVDVDIATAIADVNGETLGTYWKLHWFNNNSVWTKNLPDGGYALVTGSLYETLGMGIKSEAQYRAAKPDLLEWKRYLQDTGSPDLSTEIEIIGAETVEYTPPTITDLGVNAYYALFVTPRDKDGRTGTQVQVNNEYTLVS